MLAIGSVIDGKYKILNEVGHGGMSVVYLAINERANKTWALKEVRKDGSNDTEVVKQGLMAETEMLKKLNHPNLPSIIDVIDQDDSFIIVMDFIEGRSLQELVQKGGPQQPEKVVEWAMQLCDVLSYLHSRQPPIIYRDMKPANIMLEPSGQLKLIDFGTAREYKVASVGDTTLLGTRGYAAPEQFGGHGQSDARTDIYCLGATMYHLLTGCSPADTGYAILPLRELDPAFAGTGLEKVVAKCCALDPANRYQNCAELMYALEHVRDEDDEAIRKRGMAWDGFLASVCAAVLGLGGTAGLCIAAAMQGKSYSGGIIACLALGAVALLCAVLVYFLCDIRAIFAMRSGRAQRETMQKLQQANARTDVLRSLAETAETRPAPPPAVQTAPMPTAPMPAAQTAPMPATQTAPMPAAQTAPMPAAQTAPMPAAQTAPMPAAQPAAVLGNAVPPLTPTVPAGFRFVITEQILAVHSDELL